MGWVLLFSAGLAEIIFAISLKYNMGFTKLYPSIVTGISGGASFYLLMLAIKTLPLGTAYAIWTGMGAVGVAILSIFLFKESTDLFRLVSIGLIVLGIMGLKLTDAEEPEEVRPVESVRNELSSWQFGWHKSQLAGFDKTPSNMGWRQSDALCFDVSASPGLYDVTNFKDNCIKEVKIDVKNRQAVYRFNYPKLENPLQDLYLSAGYVNTIAFNYPGKLGDIWQNTEGRVYQFNSNDAYWYHLN